MFLYWLLVGIGFLIGLVVAVIFWLLIGGRSGAKVEPVEDERAAQLAKAEVKLAVLEDRLRESESIRAQERAALEQEYQQKLEATAEDYLQKLAVLEAHRQAAELQPEMEPIAETMVPEEPLAEEAAFQEVEFEFDGEAEPEIAGEVIPDPAVRQANIAAAATAEAATLAALSEAEERRLRSEWEEAPEISFEFDMEAEGEEAVLAPSTTGIAGDELDQTAATKGSVALAAAALAASAKLAQEEEPASAEPVTGDLGSEPAPEEAAAPAGEPQEAAAEEALPEPPAEEDSLGERIGGNLGAGAVALGAAAIAVGAKALGSEEESAATSEEQLAYSAPEASAPPAEEPEPVTEHAPDEEVEPSILQPGAAAVGALFVAGLAAEEIAERGEEEAQPVSEEDIREAAEELAAERGLPATFLETAAGPAVEGEAIVYGGDVEAPDLPAPKLEPEELQPSAAALGALSVAGMIAADVAEEDEMPAEEGIEEESVAESQSPVEALPVGEVLREPDREVAAAEKAALQNEGAGEPAEVSEDATWHGEYFNNVKLKGDPALTREDGEIDFDWGFGSPAPEIQADGFSARWTRAVYFRPGLYRFVVSSDDGVRFYVNDRLIISAWYDHNVQTFRREMELPGGLVNLRLEYYENIMEAVVRLAWEKIG